MIFERRTRGHARQVVGLAVATPLVFAVATGLARAVTASAPWTQAKAGRIVERDATVRFSPSARAALESELLTLEREYRQLENAAGATEEHYGYLPGRLHNLRYRYSTALKTVRAGLPVATATCLGAGRPVRGRFMRFTCDATSQTLRIPVADVTWEDGRIAGVLEREPRVIGPLRAGLSVRVTSKSRMAFSQR